MVQFTLFDQLMYHIYLQEIDEAIDLLDNHIIDVHFNDDQLFRELNCSRLTGEDTARVMKKLINKMLK